MNSKLLTIVASMSLATFLWGCEINIEAAGNPVVDEDASNNGGANNGGANNGTNPDGGTEPNDEWPCKDNPEIPRDQCQGGAEWDRYEDPELIERGQYVVRHVASCADCHTPLNPDFTPKANCVDDNPWWAIRDCDKELAGFNFPFLDWAPDVEGLGVVAFPNLTPHPDGLGEWSPEELRTAFTRGIRPERITDKPRLMWPLMPYWNFYHMTERDQDAVIAYLHSLTPVPNGEFPGAGPTEREPQPEDSPFRALDLAQPVDRDGDGELEGIGPTPEDWMPAVMLSEDDPNYDKAVEGQYLARMACSLCHSPAVAPPAGTTAQDVENGTYTYIDFDMAMCGSVQDESIIWSTWWPGFIFGEGFPEQIHSQNITGHMTLGVGDWTVDELIRSVNGIDKANETMCPPMYVDTWFVELTEEDKEKIAIYLKNSEPCDNNTEGVGFDCKLPAN